MILDRMIWSDSFERFVSSKYPSEKRFGLEGGESLIPGMKALVSNPLPPFFFLPFFFILLLLKSSTTSELVPYPINKVLAF